MVTATRPCSRNIWWRCNGLNARSRCPPKGHGVCVSGIISVASALVSRDADDDAQDMVRLSRVYKSSGPSHAGVTSPDVDDDVGETIT